MKTAGLFRPESLQHLDAPDVGNVLRLSQGWLSVISWLLLIVAVATGIVAARSRLPVYEPGIGVLRSGVANTSARIADCSIQSLNPASSRATSSETGSNTRAMYIAVLAGNARPKLAPGMRVLLRISGYPDVVLAARLDSVGGRLLAADEVLPVLRSLGADATTFDGPAVSICGSLQSDRFISGGVEYRLQDGMLATARVQVREQRLVNRFIPRVR